MPENPSMFPSCRIRGGATARDQQGNRRLDRESCVAALVGIDVGGTFTDLYWPRGGLTARQIGKGPSTPQDPSNGLIDALNRAEVPSDDLDLILHGTTIATNALIERRGARCARCWRSVGT